MLAVDDDDGGGDAGVESPMATSLNLTTHQLVRETKAGSTCADKWLALYSGLQKNIFDGLASRPACVYPGVFDHISTTADDDDLLAPSHPQLFRRGIRRHETAR